MTIKSFTWFTAVSLVLLLLSAPKAARADILIVEHNPSGSNHFGTIQEAINHAKSLRATDNTVSVTIKVRADDVPYSGSFTPISNVPIQGESETARTLITGGGTSPLVTFSGVSNVTIKNLTFVNTSSGILVTNSTSITISNNIFQGITGSAVQVTNSDVTIINNTFYGNGTAVATASDIEITNNIFSTNTTAISTAITLNKVSYNDFHQNQHDGITVSSDPTSLPNIKATSDPLFVDPATHDFHLKAGSPAHAYAGIDAGNPNNPNIVNPGSFDMGAYGGPFSDTVPKQVTHVGSILVSPDSVKVSWDVNQSYQVTGYRVYSGSASRTYSATPLSITQGTNTATLANLVSVTTPPAAPRLTSISPRNQALALTWEPVAGATNYNVYYRPTPPGESAPPIDKSSSSVPAGNKTSFVLRGLANGVKYDVAVSAVIENRIFIAVTAVNNDAPVAASPPGFNESAFSQEVIETIGATLESEQLSNPMSDFPEGTVGYPNLKSEGCFIATAAFGFYSAPQVQALRDFRDRYLLTNAPGRAFVAWYYRYGPRGAHFINLHPWLKPPVRLALLPLVAGSLFLTGSSAPVKLAVAALALVLVAMLLHRNRWSTTTPGWRHWKKFSLTLLLIILPALAQGAETRSDRPHWSLELKGGAFFPEINNWSKFYGSSYTWEYGGALAYKVHRQLEVGIEGTYLRATGKGQLPQHALPAGEVTNQLVPLNVFVLARGVFNEGQLVVPYAAAGYTRMFYRQKVEGQGTTQGSVNGFHARGGVQLLLDGLEADASRSLYADYGIHHTYLFAEAKYVRAMADTVSGGSVNLGGTGCLGGFLFEF